MSSVAEEVPGPAALGTRFGLSKFSLWGDWQHVVMEEHCGYLFIILGGILHLQLVAMAV